MKLLGTLNVCGYIDVRFGSVPYEGSGVLPGNKGKTVGETWVLVKRRQTAVSMKRTRTYCIFTLVCHTRENKGCGK